MAKLKTKFIEDNAVTGAKLRLSNNEALKARNAANSADVNILKLNASDIVEFSSQPTFGTDPVNANDLVRKSYLSNYQATSEKGAVNGYASLDGTGKVPSAQLPSYVDDVLEYANLAAFPGTGATGLIYVALDTNKVYRWTGSIYVEISPSEVNSVNGSTGIVVLDTDDVSEGSTNLYHTTARARAAAVVNSTAGNETDQAASVSAMKAYVTANSANITAKDEKFTLVAGDITNGYIDLGFAGLAGSFHVTPVGGLLAEVLVDYTISLTGGAGGVTRITFAGDLLELVVTDELMVKYLVDA